MYDYLIQNGMLADGTGAPSYRADLAVQGGRIAAIAERIDAEQAEHVIDAAGRYVTPGFLDIHRHADAACFKPSFGEPEMRQGLTTIVNGNCGLSIAPCPSDRKAEIEEYLTPVTGLIPEGTPVGSFKEYKEALDDLHLPLHVETLIGDGTCSAAVKGYGSEQPDEEQVQKIRKNLESALTDGACGISLGLGYAPECLYTTETLIRLLAPLSGSGKPLTTHIRGEGDSVHKALKEVIRVAKALDVQLEVSHLKCIGSRNWGEGMREALAIMDRARADGLDIACDLYPYTAGSTQLIILLPNRFKKNGIEQLLKDLKDPNIRREMTKELSAPSEEFENTVELVGWDHIRMSTLFKPQNRKFQGMTVTEIAKLRGQDPFDCAYDMLIEEEGIISMTDQYASEDDVIRALQYPFSSVISDSIYPEGILHPRVYGTYLRMLEEYVRENPIMPFEEAIRKMTLLPAQTMHFDRKGQLQTGKDADLLIFDLNRIHTGATYETPDVLGEGIDWSFTGGVPRIADGVWLG